MSKLQFCILLLVLGACAAVPVIRQRKAEVRLREENRALRQQADKLTHVSADNQRLSNVLSEVRLAQVDARNHFPELVALRSEVARLKGLNEHSDAALKAVEQEQRGEVAMLRAELARLSEEAQELESLRDEVRQLRTAAPTPAAEETPASDARETENRETAIRMIRTQGDAFAEKLKSSVGAKDEESFVDVFSRFLQLNGIATNGIAMAAYDQRTGRVIVRGTTATLDQVERVTRALDQAP